MLQAVGPGKVSKEGVTQSRGWLGTELQGVPLYEAGEGGGAGQTSGEVGEHPGEWGQTPSGPLMQL